jgi:hypothetical protein
VGAAPWLLPEHAKLAIIATSGAALVAAGLTFTAAALTAPVAHVAQVGLCFSWQFPK